MFKFLLNLRDLRNLPHFVTTVHLSVPLLSRFPKSSKAAANASSTHVLTTSLLVRETQEPLALKALWWRNPEPGGRSDCPSSPCELPSAARLKNTLQLPHVRAP